MEKHDQNGYANAPQMLRLHIPIYIQQDETLHGLFYLETALHVSGSTTTHQQERTQLYLQHLVFVTPLLLPAAIAAGSSNGVTDRLSRNVGKELPPYAAYFSEERRSRVL